MNSEEQVRKKAPAVWALPIISQMRPAKATAEAARIHESPETREAIEQAQLEDLKYLNTLKETPKDEHTPDSTAA
ncbi:hypothetical protein [Pontibacter pamirensis]|uniref:hypothetical protein n=1 Tax=Pontibacter pamirensis TaxID=2562824 RepID=UPI001389EB62|nr:hypothetical protein [Pontibacter pamirensis]